ncbi:MAG TPA: hypothetical protein ENJ48_03210 [Anaerolineae bacterium]|nr:hypothetical protein [Anaerolineae bacterium]
MYTGVWINPQRAAKLGLKTGDKISLENTNTGQKTTGHAYITELIRPDTVFTTSALGHENEKLEIAKGVGTALNKLVPYDLEPVAGAPKTGQFTVKISRA